MTGAHYWRPAHRRRGQCDSARIAASIPSGVNANMRSPNSVEIIRVDAEKFQFSCGLGLIQALRGQAVTRALQPNLAGLGIEMLDRAAGA